MSKIQHLLGIEDIVKNLLEGHGQKIEVIKDDLYGSMKEVNSLKWRITEIELRLGNLENLVKGGIEKGG